MADVLQDVQAQIRQLGRDMGTVQSVLNRKFPLSHDERAQVWMLTLWRERLDKMHAELEATKADR
jgi:hypothetical protein